MADQAPDLAVSLREAALSMIWQDSAHDAEQTLDALVLACVDAVPGAVAAAVTHVEAGVVSSRHATGDLVRRLDEVQTHAHEGPSPTAAQTPPVDGIVCANDLHSTEIAGRWPNFAPRAVSLGARAVLWIAVGRDADRPSTGLTLWADRAAAFDSSATLTASLFASQAGMLLYGVRGTAALNRELAARDQVGQAQGLLMERFGLGRDSAFEQLVRAAREAGVDVHWVARSLIEGAERRELQNRAVEVSTDGHVAERDAEHV